MNILEFTKKFPNETTCRTYLKEKREKHGITCKKCNSKTKHYWLEEIEKFQCSKCNSRTNLRAGTIMEKSKVPVRIWFMVIHFMTSIKKPFSALEMQRQTEYKFYEPIWYMMNKIRKAMGKRDTRYKLNGDIEMDDAFFEVVDLPEKDELGNIIEEKQKAGRGSQGKQKVLIMVESRPRPQTKPYRKNREMGYVKMVTMDDLTSEGINYEVKKGVDKNATALTDAFRGYARLGIRHTPKVVPAKESMKVLPWVHTVISNAKREFLGVHHSVGKGYLQNYLNEFCYKINRRNFRTDLFDRLISAGAEETWY